MADSEDYVGLFLQVQQALDSLKNPLGKVEPLSNPAAVNLQEQVCAFFNCGRNCMGGSVLLSSEVLYQRQTSPYRYGGYRSDDFFTQRTPELWSSDALVLREKDNSPAENSQRPQATLFSLAEMEKLTFEQLRARFAEPAPIGDLDLGATAINESVRVALEIPTERWAFQMDPQTLDAFHHVISKGLAGGRPVRLVPYKLNVYGPGGFFDQHLDSPSSADMLGSLVIGLPGAHEGGQLVIHSNDQELVFDFGQELKSMKTRPSWSRSRMLCDQLQLPWAAFLGDVVHEVKPVRSGLRVTATYQILYAPDLSLTTPPNKDDETAAGSAHRRQAGTTTNFRGNLKHNDDDDDGDDDDGMDATNTLYMPINPYEAAGVIVNVRGDELCVKQFPKVQPTLENVVEAVERLGDAIRLLYTGGNEHVPSTGHPGRYLGIFLAHGYPTNIATTPQILKGSDALLYRLMAEVYGFDNVSVTTAVRNRSLSTYYGTEDGSRADKDALDDSVYCFCRRCVFKSAAGKSETTSAAANDRAESGHANHGGRAKGTDNKRDARKVDEDDQGERAQDGVNFDRAADAADARLSRLVKFCLSDHLREQVVFIRTTNDGLVLKHEYSSGGHNGNDYDPKSWHLQYYQSALLIDLAARGEVNGRCFADVFRSWRDKELLYMIDCLETAPTNFQWNTALANPSAYGEGEGFEDHERYHMYRASRIEFDSSDLSEFDPHIHKRQLPSPLQLAVKSWHVVDTNGKDIR